jgi:hypothetical protein
MDPRQNDMVILVHDATLFHEHDLIVSRRHRDDLGIEVEVLRPKLVDDGLDVAFSA